MSCEIDKDVLLLKLQQLRMAVASKDLLPILTFVNLHEGFLSAYDGRHAIRLRLPQLTGINANVKFDKFLRAVDAAEGLIKLDIVNNKLVMKSGRFKAQMSITTDLFPYQLDESKAAAWEPIVDENFIECLRMLIPFTSQNMSRPWQTGIWLNGTHAYATDNAALARVRCDWPLEPVLLPRAVVQELCSVAPAISCVTMLERRVLFDCDSFIMDIQCLSESYPPSVVEMLNNVEKLGVTELIPEGLRNAVLKVSGFVSDEKFPCVSLGPEGVRTEGREDFAEVDGYKLPKGDFNPQLLMQVLDVATHMNLSTFPQCAFKGQRIIGLVAGMRK